MALEGTVKIPGLGAIPKKEATIGFVIVGGLIVVYYVRKGKSSTASATTTAAAAATASDQYPPDGTVGNPQDPYSTDPATNQTYGDEATGLSGGYGAYGSLGSATTDTYPWDGTTGNEADPYSLDPASGVTFGDEGLATGGTNANPNGGPPFSSNSAWSNWVIQQLQNQQPGLDVGALTDALGLYLNGQPVDTSQQQLIFDAQAIGGPPPVAGANNYPPNVHLNGNTGGSGSTGGGSGTGTGGGTGATTMVTIPVTFGERANTAIQNIEAAGLTVTTSPARDKTKTYVSTGSVPEGGKQAAKGSHVTLNVKEQQ